MVITECVGCDNTTRHLSYNRSLTLDLPCGNTYSINVKAVTASDFNSADSKVTMSIKPEVGSVTNLVVKFIPGDNRTGNATTGNSTDGIKQLQDGFLLTWGPPNNVKPASIKVGNRLC